MSSLLRCGPLVAPYLTELVERTRTTLPQKLFGVYLTGSLAMGGYLQGRSDIDITLLVDAELTAADKDDLVARIRHRALACPARGLELVVYRADVVREAHVDPAFELELNDGTTMPFGVNSTATERDSSDGLFWYALDRDIVAQRGIALAGPPASDVFGRLSDQDLRKVLADALHWHAVNGSGGINYDNAVLNACRGLIRVETGWWFSKPEAASRALELGVPLRLKTAIRQALWHREHDSDPQQGDAAAALHYVANRIAT